MAPDNGTEQFASLEDAAKAYTDVSDTEAPEEDQDNQEVEESEEGDPAGDADTDTDESGDASEEGDEGSEPYDGGRFAADAAKVRLEDGTVTTIAELKKGNLLHADWTRKSMAAAEERKAVEQKAAQFQSIEAKLQQEREFVSFVASQLLPQEPNPQMLADGDVIGFNMAQAAYQQQTRMVGQLVAQYQEHQQQVAKQQEDSLKQTKLEEWDRLKERAPDLADPAKYQAFWGEALKAAEHYGFSQKELSGMVDHRQYLVLRDALAYRRIKAKSGQPNPKVQGKPPVLNGDRRRSQGELQQRDAKTAMARLNQTGTVKDAVAALLALEKG